VFDTTSGVWACLGAVNRKLFLVINSCDDNYIPHRIIVMGGSAGNLQKLNDVTVDQLVYLRLLLGMFYDERYSLFKV